MRGYRGLLRNEYVQVYRRTTTDDGMCGKVPAYTLHLSRYFCRIWFAEEEAQRTDEGERQLPVYGMVGDLADIRQGDKLVRSTGEEFTLTFVRQPIDGRVRHHLIGRLRRIVGDGTSQ